VQATEPAFQFSSVQLCRFVKLLL